MLVSARSQNATRTAGSSEFGASWYSGSVEHGVELGHAEERLPQPFARLRELHPPPVSRQSDQETKEQRVVRDEPLLVDGRRGSERARVLRR